MEPKPCFPAKTSRFSLKDINQVMFGDKNINLILCPGDPSSDSGEDHPDIPCTLSLPAPCFVQLKFD